MHDEYAPGGGPRRVPHDSITTGVLSPDVEWTSGPGRAVLNYPSVRLASGQVTSWEWAEDYSIPWDLYTEVEGWHHS